VIPIKGQLKNEDHYGHHNAGRDNLCRGRRMPSVLHAHPEIQMSIGKNKLCEFDRCRILDDPLSKGRVICLIELARSAQPRHCRL
jgi:hypothetical protein